VDTGLAMLTVKKYFSNPVMLREEKREVVRKYLCSHRVLRNSINRENLNNP
jgi:hypothetical protein